MSSTTERNGSTRAVCVRLGGRCTLDQGSRVGLCDRKTFEQFEKDLRN